MSTKIIEKAGATYIEFSGSIDEQASFDTIPYLDASTVFLDLEKVSHLNSLGLKKWIIWVRQYSGHVSFVFEKCPPMVVQQMSVLAGFLPSKAKVSSLFLPYVCDSCGEETIRLAQNGSHYFQGTADVKPGFKVEEEIKCPNCGEDAEVDVVLNRFFGFLFLK